MSATTLDELLDRDRTFDAEMANTNSDHLSMALVGLARLGAPDDRLRAYADGYVHKLRPLRPRGDDIDPDHELRPLLGSGRRYPDLLAWFDGAITREGLAPTLHRHLPLLTGGSGGAAFHGAIRTAYALEHGRGTDAAAGLAYFADTWQATLEPPPAPTGEGRAILDVLTDVHDHPRLHRREFARPGFSARFAEATALPELRELLADLRVDHDTLREVAAAAHVLYRATGDFFALHTMTATQATRVIGAHLPDDAATLAAIGELARAVVVAYVVIATPDITTVVPSDEPVPGWPDIASAAIASPDEHVIKLVYTCREESIHWGDPTYRDTAARVVGLVG